MDESLIKEIHYLTRKFTIFCNIPVDHLTNSSFEIFQTRNETKSYCYSNIHNMLLH